MAGQYRFKDSNGNIVAQISASVGGAIAFSGSVVDFTQANNVILGNVQLAGTASNALLLDGFDSQAFAFTSSIHPFTASIAGTNTFTSSASTRLNLIETITASNIARLNSLEEKTGSLATTGSNTFIGTQTITGSLYITTDLIVQGSSSLQNITASAVSIGTNIVSLNTANPAIRYAGLSIGDSGSVGGSGSFLYDSVQDEMIFIHRGANTTVTSSVTLMGPQTFDNVGNETYPTSNIIQKGTGNEHLVDSCIFDNGTTICTKGNFIGTGTACFGSTTTIACNLIVGNTSTSSSITLTGASISGFNNGYIQWGNGNQTTAGLNFNSPGTNVEITTGFNERITLSTGTGLQVYTNNGSGPYTSRMLLDRSGNACFSGNICGLTLTTTGDINLSNDKGIFIKRADGTLGQAFFLGSGNELNIGFGVADTLRFATYLNTERLRISSTGIACFACPVSISTAYNSSYGKLQVGGIADSFGNDAVWRVFNAAASFAGGTGTDAWAFAGNNTDLALYGANDLYLYSNGARRLQFTTGGIACFRCQVCAAGLTVRNTTASGTNIESVQATDANACAIIQARWDGGVGMRMYYHPNSAVGVIENTYQSTSGQVYGDILFRQNVGGTQVNRLRIQADGGTASFACTVCSGGSLARKGYDYHTGGQWFKIPFYIEKGNGTGNARTVCLITIDNNDSFQELIFTIEYGSRLQGVSDSNTQTSLRTYGVNRFVGGTASVTDSNLITGGSGCAINTHAPMSVAIAGSCMSVVKVDFSSSLGSSSFVWGEVRIFSIESLAGKITIANNNY